MYEPKSLHPLQILFNCLTLSLSLKDTPNLEKVPETSRTSLSPCYTPATYTGGLTIENILKFNPRARIIRTIGDQLISGPEAAIVELVKNAYDADASRVIVKFTPPLLPNDGTITISDNGHGMPLSVIREKWMEPATTAKLLNRKSPGGRAMMGSKGIGRFAAAKLGKKMALNSTVKTKNGKTEVLIPEIN